MAFRSSERLPRVVIVLGLVSFLNDLASEMVTPLIPLLLAGVLGAGPVALGIVEGVAEATAAWIKLWAGRRSDRIGGRRKGFVLVGYGLSNLVRPLLGFATSWTVVAALRGLDRVGKGVRTAPRDALVADGTPERMRGRAYGFHRALDNGGAFAGALLAAALLTWLPLSLPQVMLVSALPGVAGVALVAFGVERVGTAAPSVAVAPLAWRLLSPTMRRYLLALAVFMLVHVPETFVVLRGNELGMGTVELLLLWAAMNLAKSLSALRGGHLSDRIGHGRTVAIGWLLHGLSFALLAGVAAPAALWAAALVYGLLTGVGEGAERALVGALAAADERGTAFGWYNMTVGLAAIPSGLVFGGLWATAGAGVAFSAAAVAAVGAMALLNFWVLRRR